MSSMQPPRRGGGGRSGSGRNQNSNNGGRSSRPGSGASQRNRNNNRRPARQRSQSNADSESSQTLVRDEDVLIAFMPYLKGYSSPEATRIYEEYQSSGDQRAFLQAAREFLQQGSTNQQTTTDPMSPNITVSTRSEDMSHMPAQPLSHPSSPPSMATDRPNPTVDLSVLFPTASAFDSTDPFPGQSRQRRPDPPGMAHIQRSPARHFVGNNLAYPSQPLVGQVDDMTTIENGFSELFTRSNDTELSRPPIAASSNTGRSSLWFNSSDIASPITPPRPTSLADAPTSPWESPSPQKSIQLSQRNIAMPSSDLNSFSQQPLNMSSIPSPRTPGGTRFAQVPVISDSSTEKQQDPFTPIRSPDSPMHGPRSVKKEVPPAKRLWTHTDEQPGRIFVDGFSGTDASLVLPLAPRQELIAQWSLPLQYLLKRSQENGQSVDSSGMSLDRMLNGLSVGLFRRGCTENGDQASIISKVVIGEDRSYEYGLDHTSNTVQGKVPFYSPRTPGNVLFRLYWRNDPLYTLAIGPTLHVRVTEKDFESSIRFILSNFKGKKSNPTSLSSLNSLAQVLETPLTQPNESAARAVWGCIQEARKVIEACFMEHTKTSQKLSQLEESVDDLKKKVEGEDAKSHTSAPTSEEDADDDAHLSENALSLREKTRALMSGRASCERKWRDSQLAFAGILKAIVSNASMNILLRRDMIAKLRLEYELWCPLSEEFALPDESCLLWFDHLKDSSATPFSTREYSQARVKMQMRTLGFEPNSSTLETVLFSRSSGAQNTNVMDPGAVSVFNRLSSSMGQYYQDLFADEELVVRRRELIRQLTEQCVVNCGAFPPGTRVAIFGSAANGFGSPKSDIDMCLQLPSGPKLSEEEKAKYGAPAMAKLAVFLQERGMKEVDTCRLTARIPIVKYQCLNPLMDENDDAQLIECDLSMHNPLAVVNTSLLRSYAEITPVTRVLASVIKRWAKARDINNPSRHTLSSYGYTIMLLHFLTYHKRTGNGLITTIAPAEGNPLYRSQPAQPAPPILPNLQWVDPAWPTFPRGTPYRELPLLPKQMIDHPIEEGKTVNTYFYKPTTPNEKTQVQMLFTCQDLSLAILLASFFRYYAYEFDFKNHVVSLHSTATRGIVDREVKAELDCWRNYSAALAIEDPFETFYDVAHVLRGGFFHRIRRELAVAYSKVADAASGRQASWDKRDLRAMTGDELIDWICEPVASDREHQ